MTPPDEPHVDSDPNKNLPSPGQSLPNPLQRPHPAQKTGLNIMASVRARLLNLAKARRENFDFLLNRYANERLLYRLSQSTHASGFVVKGATLFSLWSQTPHRPTRDLDLLGNGDPSVPHLETVFREIVAMEVEDDGLSFDAALVSGQPIKEEEQYEGVRVRLLAMLGGARIPLQIDIGFGDVVTPAATLQEFPSLLGQHPPRLRVYPRETVIAEKFEAMAKLGQSNSRMKDFYDVWFLSRAQDWDEALLRRAILATFTRRQSALPQELALALQDTFGADSGKATQWNAFCRKNGLGDAPAFPILIQELRTFLWPIVNRVP